jgi:SAM-dependent methyltransferase
MSTIYDDVPYPTSPHDLTHPSRMAAVGVLLGLSPTVGQPRRVLEIGCGSGGNLLNMAASAPDSEFVGFDLAPSAIARARDLAAAAGLENAAFHTLDITRAAGPIAGRFDAIVAHGVYAWTPAPVRAALMALAGDVLAPSGLLFLSYNVSPGCGVRAMIRVALLDAVAGLTDPAARLAAAQARLTFLATDTGSTDSTTIAVRDEAARMLERPAEVLFHDELGPCFEPQSLASVVTAAEANGLRYLADAALPVSAELFFPTPSRDDIREITGGDWARFEQLDDLRTARRFRQSLLCRADARPNLRLVPERLARLHASAPIEAAPPDPERPDSRRFKFGSGPSLGTTDARFADLLDRLIAAKPGYLALAGAVEDPELAEALMRLVTTGLVSLHAEPAPYVSVAGERPRASPLALAQCREGQAVVSTLRHQEVSLESEQTRLFVSLLDGTRTRDDLDAHMTRVTGAPAEDVRTINRQGLDMLAGLGLLVA